MNQTTLQGPGRVKEFLATDRNVAKLSGETITKIKSQKMSLKDAILVNRTDVTGFSGKHKLFEGEDKKKQGIRNFADGKLPENRPFVIQSVKLGVKETDKTDPAAVNDYSTLRSDFPAALVNGKLIVSQFEKPVFELEIVSGVVNAVPASVTGKDDVKDFENLALLVDGHEFTWELETANGLSITPVTSGNKIMFEVIMIGSTIVFD